MTKARTIKLDEAVARTIEERADECGTTVPHLLAELVRKDCTPVDVDADQIAELNRRWAAVEAGQPTVSNDKVAHWLCTWGSPAFKPWREFQ